MSDTARTYLVCLLAFALLFAIVPAHAGAQALDYQIVPSVTSIPAGSAGASISATIQNAPSSLNFGLCFVTGYGSNTPIVPSSFALAGTSATVAFSVPASTIQDVPPSAFTSGSFAASLYAVPVNATACAGTAPAGAAVVTLNFPRLSGISLPSAPQLNPKLTSRLPAKVTLSGASFLSQSAPGNGASSTVTFTSNAAVPGAVKYISPTTLVSSIPTSIDPYVPSVKVQVCNTTSLYTYCSNVRNLPLYALPMDDGTVTASPNVALATQKVTVSATFGARAPSIAGAPGGFATFHYASTVLGSAPLTLDPTGSFVAANPTTLRAKAAPANPILADFNQDGVPDLLMLEPGSSTLHILLGSSPSGSFATDHPLAPLANGITILDTAVADFNGDGFPDIALLGQPTGSSSSTIFILLNDGSGNFAAPVTGFATVYGSHILAADFNYDGHSDLAIAGAIDASGTTGLQVLLGDGTGNFTAGPSTPDLNTAPSASFGGFQIVTADFNGDNFPDIAILNGASGSQITKSIAVYQNDGKGNFAAPVTVATDGTASAAFSFGPLAPGQFPSIFVSSSTGLSVAINQGTSAIAFSTPLTSTAIPGLKKAVVGDFNGDGLLDAAVDDGTTVHVLNGDGKGGFAATYTSLSIPSAAGSSLLAGIDVNLDTYADLLSFSASGNGIYTLQAYVTSGTATATLPPSLFPVGVHTIVARTPGTFYLECASVTTTLTINPIATAISVSSSVTSSVTYGQPVTFSATVADPTATGKVSFYNGSTLLGSAPVVDSTSATAQFVSAALPAGSYNLQAVYSGDALHASATSQSLTFQILAAAPAIAWPTPASIIFGTALSAAQLDAVATGVTGANLPGVFTYTPALGTVPPSGTQTLKTVFTPTDSTDYTTASASVTITVVPFTLSGLSSDLAVLGDPDKTITVTGSGFFPSAKVLINGAPVTTTFVSSTALMAILPARNFLTARTLQIAVADSAQSPLSTSLPFYVVAPLASVVFSGPSSIVPGTQITLTFELTNPYPVPLTSVFTLGFSPANGLPSDPNVLFSSGSDTYTVVIPANSTASPQVLVQTGTIVGALTVGLDLMAGGTDVTPSSVHPLNIQAPPSVPGVTSVTATRNGNILTVNVHGFSNTRELSMAKFHFTPISGKSIGTPDVAINVSSLFATWYADPASIQYGSAFTYTQVFDLTSDASVVGEVTVVLDNTVGGSTPVNTQ